MEDTHKLLNLGLFACWLPFRVVATSMMGSEAAQFGHRALRCCVTVDFSLGFPPLGGAAGLFLLFAIKHNCVILLGSCACCCRGMQLGSCCLVLLLLSFNLTIIGHGLMDIETVTFELARAPNDSSDIPKERFTVNLSERATIKEGNLLKRRHAPSSTAFCAAWHSVLPKAGGAPPRPAWRPRGLELGAG